LSICYGIVREMRGVIELQSRVGEGTRVVVRLPLSTEVAAVPAPPPVPVAPRPPAPPVHGGETILLVEDEKILRDLTATILRDLGYHVIEAEDGDSAVAASAASPREIQLVLCDVVLPGLRGGAVVRQLRQQRPRLRVLFMSGYVDHVAASDEALHGAPMLAKPFTVDELVEQLRQVLDAPA
jgi:CheY-like chemotaxis protein